MAKKKDEYLAPQGMQSQQPSRQGMGMAPQGGYPRARGGAINMPPMAVGVPIAGAPQQQRRPRPSAPPPPPLTKKEQKKLNRQKRKEKDYFFVMRKGVCFLLFLVCLVVFAFSAIGAVGAFVELPDMLNQFTAVAVEQDITPLDERETIEDEAGEEVTVDNTKYLSAADLMLSAINGLVELPFYTNEEGETKAVFYNATLETLKTNAELEENEDSMKSIALYAFQYGPLGLVLTMVASLIAAITSFLGMFGKRIFKGFGLAGIFMLLGAVCMVLCGLVGFGVQNGHPYVDEDENLVSAVDFGSLMPFITGAFQQPFETAADAAESETELLEFTAGIGAFALLGGSVLVIVLSLFARKKIPYSIFDR